MSWRTRAAFWPRPGTRSITSMTRWNRSRSFSMTMSNGVAVGMLALGLEAHEVDDVDHAHLQVRQVPADEVGGGQRLEGRDVAAAGQDHVGLPVVVVARPVPDPEAPGAVQDGVLDRQPVGGGLLAGDDDVDVVTAPQAVVGHREQAR